MVHRVPLRRARYTELMLCCCVLLAVAVCLAVFFWFKAPNWDVVLLHLSALVLLFMPLPPLFIRFWGQRLLQVEHAGVVVGTLVFGKVLRLQVWQAQQVRAFDWDAEADGGFSLRLLLDTSPHLRPVWSTVLYTESPYLLAAVWKDLELHYPGCGGGRELPGGTEGCGEALPSRIGAGLCIACGMLLLAVAWPRAVYPPLYVLGAGRTTPAEIAALVWDSSRRGSSYHVEVSPAGCDTRRRSATAFPQSASMPQVGQRLAAVWADDAQSPFYMTDEVVPFMLPLVWGGGSLMMVCAGALQLLRRRKR